ncbi:universal stress protein [Capnocytophaga sp. ARDL2]|uniref:universal stress protein n=1 Tax=Capnocytophaga sp. ARDL2 TaxID=3238809 RepID=UPI00355927BB
MKTILFPTDFSVTAENAFIYALQIAHQLKAQLIVFHHFEMPIVSSSHAGQPELINEVYETIEMNRFEDFKKEVSNLRKIADKRNLSDVEMTFLMEEGLFVTNVENIVEKESIDLIVMGTSGANNLEKKIFGTNAVRILENVTVPVLSIPAEAHYEGVKTIGFATSLSESNKKALNIMVDFAQSINAELLCLHVMKKEDEQFDKVLKPWIEEFGPKGVTFHTAVNEDVEQGLFFLIDKYNVDALVTVKRKMNFLEKMFKTSLSNSMNTHSYVPILTFKE